MTEQELRALVRDAIARQRDRTPSPGRVGSVGEGGRSLSFGLFAVPSGPEGTCIIEPSVMCNHCGYCKSYGH